MKLVGIPVGRTVGKVVILSIVGLVAITLFMKGIDQGLDSFIGGLAWYWYILIALALSFVVGRKVIGK